MGVTYVCRTPKPAGPGKEAVQGCGAGTWALASEPAPLCPLCRKAMRDLGAEYGRKLAAFNAKEKK